MVAYLRERYPDLPLALVGFSFGAYVFARTARDLAQPAEALVLMGLPVGTVPGGRHYEPMALPADCLLLHGEADEMAPLANLLLAPIFLTLQTVILTAAPAKAFAHLNQDEIDAGLHD